MKKDKDQSKYYHISSVARLYNIHPQTLRLYEREGLLKPSRSDGNTRLYSDEDLRQLEVILNLSRDLGVNLAGIEIILNMRRKIERIEEEINQFLEYIRLNFFEGREEEFEKTRMSLVRQSAAKLVIIEKIDTIDE
jgi:MerR family transcriptional regulator/heat shock protein HspR